MVLEEYKQYSGGFKLVFVQFLAIIITIILVKPDNWYTMSGLITVITLSISSLYKVYNKERLKFKQIIKTALRTFTIVSIIYLIIKYLNEFGIIGVILGIIGIAIWKMWRARDFLSEQKAKIEIMMFGEPQTLSVRKKMGYEGTFKEYWRNRKNEHKKES